MHLKINQIVHILFKKCSHIMKCAKKENKGRMNRGMWKNKGEDYSIILLSNSHYTDVTINNDTIIYSGEGKEGFDQKYNGCNKYFKQFIDKSKNNGNHRKVKVYKKIKNKKCIRLGYFYLKATWIDNEDGLKVVKFLLTR